MGSNRALNTEQDFLLSRRRRATGNGKGKGVLPENVDISTDQATLFANQLLHAKMDARLPRDNHRRTSTSTRDRVLRAQVALQLKYQALDDFRDCYNPLQTRRNREFKRLLGDQDEWASTCSWIVSAEELAADLLWMQTHGAHIEDYCFRVEKGLPLLDEHVEENSQGTAGSIDMRSGRSLHAEQSAHSERSRGTERSSSVELVNDGIRSDGARSVNPDKSAANECFEEMLYLRQVSEWGNKQVDGPLATLLERASRQTQAAQAKGVTSSGVLNDLTLHLQHTVLPEFRTFSNENREKLTQLSTRYSDEIMPRLDHLLLTSDHIVAQVSTTLNLEVRRVTEQLDKLEARHRKRKAFRKLLYFVLEWVLLLVMWLAWFLVQLFWPLRCFVAFWFRRNKRGDTRGC